jgi:hypothetical protein
VRVNPWRDSQDQHPDAVDQTLRDERGHGRAGALVDPTPQRLRIDGGGDAGQRGPAITGTVLDTHDHVATVGVHQADHGVGQQRCHLLEVA